MRSSAAGSSAAGWRAVAPDLPAFGASQPDPPGTWTRLVERVEQFRVALELGPVVACLHDWGGLIGMRWACDNPAAVRGLVISDSGFFADGRWHGLAEVLRTPGDGEQLLESFTAEGFAGMFAQVAPGMGPEAIADYWQAFTTPERRAATLELYRSGEMTELAAYDGKLAALGVPALLLWGADDPYAPVAGAHRLAAEIPGAQLEIVEGVGHFVYDDAPDVAAATVATFLGST